ncbi:MAG: translation initiation factor IF-2 [Candidatus Shikimatogenerans sp. JK-2022]|nr:translation initiation factor IF-2 [Candidatus Shikimatogenerans bostrichidophilus]
MFFLIKKINYFIKKIIIFFFLKKIKIYNKKKIPKKKLIKKKRKKINKKYLRIVKNNILKNKKEINIYEFITIKDLSLILDVDINKILKICFSLGLIVTKNYKLKKDLINLITEELGFKINLIEKKKYLNFNINKKKKEKYIERPPIVTIMGHVDHGKTSLLDYIRKSNIVKEEVGKITQKLSIDNIKINKKKSITFIDTPGHEYFVSMRYRGIEITDIALIVISSESGIMEQTIECINNVKSENIPIIFVFTKIDKKNSNVNKIKEQLSNLNILVEDWGGNYLCQEVSIKTGFGIEKLIKKIFTISKKLKLLANINKLSSGTIIESYLDKKKGYIVKLLVQEGILKVGDYIISGIYYGKIKNIYNQKKIKINNILPSYPALVIGFNGPPYSGEKYNILKNKKEIKKISKKRKEIKREQDFQIKYFNKKNKKKRKKEFNFIINGDNYGSIDVIIEQIEKFFLYNKSFEFNIIKKSVGNINESDILLANTLNAIIIGYNVKILENKKKKIEYKKIYIFNLIYDIINFLKKKIKKYNKKEKKYIGKAKVLKVFKKNEQYIFGCLVLEGKINNKNKILILRKNNIIYDGEIFSIKRYNKNVLEVKKGYDFGIIIKNFNNLIKDDIIKSYK